MALGLAVYGLSAEREAILIADAFLLGAAGTAVSTVAPVFVISAGLTPDLEARRLTALNVCQPIGQTGLAAVLAIAATAGLSFSGRFYLAGGILFVLALVVWLTSAGPARQIRASVAAPEPSSTLPTPKRRKTLTPDFTRFLAIVFLTSVAFVGVVNQISNILPKVYGFSESQTATVVSVAGFAAIFFFFVAGRTLRRTNAVRTTATGSSSAS